MLWTLTLARAASPYAEMNADVVAEGFVPSPPEAVHAALADLGNLKTLLGCTRDWKLGGTTRGKGATGVLVYDVATLHRKLPVTITDSKAPTLVELDHPGNKGFITQWRITAVEGGSDVSVTTWINAPPWPFRKLYFNRVQPEWRTCYTDAIAALPTVIQGN